MAGEIRGIEELIKDAMTKGEFDNLSGKGKPLNLDAYFQTPEHLRMGYSMLKNNNFVPQEVQLLKDIEAVNQELQSCGDEIRKKELNKLLQRKILERSLMMERMKKNNLELN